MQLVIIFFLQVSLENKTFLIAQLSDSVPPDVNKISFGKEPIAVAIVSLAPAIAFLGTRAEEYNVDGFL